MEWMLCRIAVVDWSSEVGGQGCRGSPNAKTGIDIVETYCRHRMGDKSK